MSYLPSNYYPQYAKVLGKPVKTDSPKSFMDKFLNLLPPTTLSETKIHKYVLSSKEIWGSKNSGSTPGFLLQEFDNYLTANLDKINQSSPFLSYGPTLNHRSSKFKVYRTPLELAIERGAPLEIIMKLLEHGAKPTNTACSIIMLMASPSPEYVFDFGRVVRKKSEMDKIIELLSFAGADWSKPCAPFCKIYQENHPSFNIKSPLSDFIINHYGKEKAYSLGVSSTSMEYKIDLDKFVENVTNHRLKRAGKDKDDVVTDEMREDIDIEVSIPAVKKKYWSNP